MRLKNLLSIVGLLSILSSGHAFNCGANNCEFSIESAEVIKNCFKKSGSDTIDKDLVTKKNPNCAKAFLGNYCRVNQTLEDCKTIRAFSEELESHANCTRLDCGKSGKEDQIIKCFQVIDPKTEIYSFDENMIKKTNPNCAKAYLDTYCKGKTTANCEAVRNPGTLKSGAKNQTTASQTSPTIEDPYGECIDQGKVPDTCTKYKQCRADKTKTKQACKQEAKLK